jgi:hypothetical protein
MFNALKRRNRRRTAEQSTEVSPEALMLPVLADVLPDDMVVVIEDGEAVAETPTQTVGPTPAPEAEVATEVDPLAPLAIEAKALIERLNIKVARIHELGGVLELRVRRDVEVDREPDQDICYYSIVVSRVTRF